MTGITPSDMVVAKEMLAMVQNSTDLITSGIFGGKAFEIMVQDTIVDGIADIVSLLLVIALMYYCYK